eukprot:COSAG05_NODE_9410_length_626_cov_0.652751_1_plen_49_part_10
MHLFPGKLAYKRENKSHTDTQRLTERHTERDTHTDRAISLVESYLLYGL